jgi:hypothetical protein
MTQCSCGETLVLKPVPGSAAFPRRLECPTHGYAFQEKRNNIFGIQEFPDEIVDNDLHGWRGGHSIDTGV